MITKHQKNRIELNSYGIEMKLADRDFNQSRRSKRMRQANSRSSHAGMHGGFVQELAHVLSC